MTQQEIFEGNKLIAVFMGWELSNRGHKYNKYLPPYGYVKAHPNYLKFNLMWDWLIPVVQKIADINSNIFEKETDAWMSYYGLDSLLMYQPIERIFEEVVIIIKEYNRLTNID